MKQLQTFNFEGNDVRTLQKESLTWFSAIDVVKGLGLTNTTVAISNLDSDEVTKFNLGGLSGMTNFISEPGLYRLIGSSRKPAAHRFNRWVTHEVLPSIRKEGAYVTPKTAADWLDNPDMMIATLQRYKESQAEVQRLHDENQKLQPKADYTDRMLNNPGLETTSMVAKNYGYSPMKFNRLLFGLGIQYRRSGVWMLYAPYQDKGYTQIEPFEFINSAGMRQVSNTMKWTQRGVKFLYDTLKAEGIVPKVEQLDLGELNYGK